MALPQNLGIPAIGTKENTLTSLTLHGPNTGILEVEPVLHGIPFTCALGEADLMLWVVAVDEIFHDASGLEEIDNLAIGEGIGKRGDSPIGIDLQELAIISLEWLCKRERRLTHSSFCVFLEMSIL